MNKWLWEQPPKHRPEGILVTEKYIGLDDSSRHTPTAFGMKTTSKDVNLRIYFDSIGDIKYFAKRDWYIVQVFGKENQHYRNFYTRSKGKSERFVDALNYFVVAAVNR